MRILYGVVGEGMGHATRSRVLLEHLADQGHELLIVASGRAFGFLEGRLAGRAGVRIEEIQGFRLAYEGNTLDVPDSIAENLEDLPRNLAANTEVYRRVKATGFEPQAIFSDFEQWAYFFGRRHQVPVVSVDNLKMIDRCRHDGEIVAGSGFDYALARMTVRAKVAFAYHYLISSFFFPVIRKPRTTLVPPILRPEVLVLQREPGAHVLVYQTAAANQELVPTLQSLPFEFRAYGTGRAGQEGNVRLCPFSEQTFLEDLRTARAAIAGGGYSLMSEAVHLGVPLLSVPLEDHFEQELNARYLDRLGYGRFARKLTAEGIQEFLAAVPEFERSLATYPRQDNGYLFACVEELLWHIGRGDPAPIALSQAAIRARSGEGARFAFT